MQVKRTINYIPSINYLKTLDNRQFVNAISDSIQNLYGQVLEILKVLGEFDNTKKDSDGSSIIPDIGSIITIDPTTNHWIINGQDTGISSKGADGSDGIDGNNGVDGKDGADGITPTIDPISKHWFIGSIDTNIVAEGQDGEKGDKGDTGEQGLQGLKGDKGDKGDKGNAFTYSDFTPEQLAGLVGPQGPQGNPGPKGDTDKMIKVTPQSTTFTADINTYYIIGQASAINVTLPPVNSEYIEGFMLAFTAGADDCLTFSSNVLKAEGYEIKSGDICEVSCIYDGDWKVTVVKFN